MIGLVMIMQFETEEELQHGKVNRILQ